MLVATNMTTKKKKPRPTVIANPPPSWNMGRLARFTLTPGAPTPEFLKHLIVKKGT
jgi:hypothetical protein